MTSGLQPARAAGSDHTGEMIRSIPACVTLGVRASGPGQPPGCRMDGTLPALCEADGRFSRGAALILADQALAAGVFAALAEPVAMMTLDLRLDWHGDLPAAADISFETHRAVHEGPHCFVEGRLLADGALVATGTGRFLIGALPGGRIAERQGTAISLPLSTAAAFDDLLAMQPDGEGWRIESDLSLVGARALPAYHGGFVAAVLEAATARLAAGHRAVDIDVRYLRPARADLPMHIIARPVRAGQLASVLDAEIRQGDALVAVARALFSGAPAERGITHRFDQSDELC
ncbi:hypothetical protein FJQ54_13305 [Sandaracinobacter neustonicus]|uniref:Acyl-CoA thioesterase-like N-terminal HotDog domain-containing protein n=1 Tax=Sandaracinobacter neustonicus TaxID=1715348 RepID=A0A501XFS1_9SPHN|nr:acyl-CoA thioesterase domain-containing protein [Sandaracinobacter neustonicus]TPE59461.1 hypothetical protein FJQ54_13305 [Sandaracinobacter neustonicus]